MLPRKAAAERLYTQSEHRVDLAIHVAGILFAANASLWLLWRMTGLPAERRLMWQRTDGGVYAQYCEETFAKATAGHALASAKDATEG